MLAVLEAILAVFKGHSRFHFTVLEYILTISILTDYFDAFSGVLTILESILIIVESILMDLVVFLLF